MKTLVRATILILLCAFELAVISCDRDKSQNKEMPNLSPEQSKMFEAYKKGIEESKKNTVARVNGVNILMYDLVKEMNIIAPGYIKPGQKKDPKIDEKVRKDALDRLIYRELAVQEALRKGMKVAPEMVADELKNVKANTKSEKVYRENLLKSGLTEEDLKKNIERNLLIGMITEEEVFNKVSAIDLKQAKMIYAKEKTSYKGPSGKQMSFEEARPLIEQKLMTAAVQKREDKWVEEMKKSAKIEITLGESAKEIHSVK